MSLCEQLNAFLELAKNAGCERLCVAYSGGIDSHVLLSQLNSLNHNLIALDAIYINHNLQESAEAWGTHCGEICKSLNVPFKQINVDAEPKNGESPEEKARIARYDALANELGVNEWLLTAQHKEDQAETLLLQLMRGSGVDGLSAMPTERSLGNGMHYRPLLDVTKQQIIDYAKQQNLQWIEDPSNQDQRIPRNYLRQSVLPAFQQFWPETTSMISTSAKWIAESAEIMADVAKQDWEHCRGDYQSLNLIELKKLTFIRQKNLLRYWFHQLGLKRPGHRKITLIFEQIIDARDDANPQLDWQGISIRRYRDNLYRVSFMDEVDSNWTCDWNAKSDLSLAHQMGILSVSESMAESMDHGLSHSFQNKPLTLRLRKGGEHCHPLGRGRSRSLKKLFHEFSIPPWLRARWPLLYFQEQLIAVPGLFVCKGFEAKANETGLELTIKDKK